MYALAGTLSLLILIPLSLLVAYEWFLALVSFQARAPFRLDGVPKTRFLILIPAHNEELGIAGTLRSITEMHYPPDLYTVVVVADRCTDNTVGIVTQHGVRCLQRQEGLAGKGATIAWGVQESRAAGVRFDALVIVDADTLVDSQLLHAFDAAFQRGHQVQQGYNYISNPWASPFTRIIAVTGVLRNARFYAAKTYLGIPGMLTGTGMCLSEAVLTRHGWQAFSVGEDWEFSVDLLLAGERIYFNPLARTLARESQDLQQASRQRLRWASGRYAVTGNKVGTMVAEGLKTGRWSLVDAAVTLMAPNYSSQASLALLSLAGSAINFWHPDWSFTAYWAAGLLTAIAAYFLLGVFSTESPKKALAGLLMIPVVLPWRLAIEVAGLLGFGRKNWGRMSRPGTPVRDPHS